ncbi:hypothetical protein ACFVSW_20245 [Neobacillus sp. NPDC058068]|uniref:spike base protein, RCAP_Rcc01079 family n=1 Tax=Neobacillus sp. NPDC058068 TaxID=3346325 RepID=UPI0036DD7392
MPDINRYQPSSGRKVKENGDLVNTADMIEAIYKAFVVNKDAGMQLNGSKAVKAVAIVPSDTVDIPVTAGLYVGTGGDIKMTMSDGSVVTRKNVAGGVTHPWSIKRIWAGGTTASDMVGDY